MLTFYITGQVPISRRAASKSRGARRTGCGTCSDGRRKITVDTRGRLVRNVATIWPKGFPGVPADPIPVGYYGSARTHSKSKENFDRAYKTCNHVASRTLTYAAVQQEGVGMAEVRYLVSKRNGEWKVKLGNFRMGSYPDRIHAIDAAIVMADRDGRDGCDSQVLVRGENRQTLIEWTYGRDPYPDSVAYD